MKTPESLDLLKRQLGTTLVLSNDYYKNKRDKLDKKNQLKRQKYKEKEKEKQSKHKKTSKTKTPKKNKKTKQNKNKQKMDIDDELEEEEEVVITRRARKITPQKKTISTRKKRAVNQRNRIDNVELAELKSRKRMEKGDAYNDYTKSGIYIYIYIFYISFICHLYVFYMSFICHLYR